MTQIVTGAFSSSGASESEFVRVNALDVTTYDGELAVEVNGGIPDFTQADLERDPFEEYSELDRLGRCGPAFALVGPDTLSTAPRGSIGEIRPSGWRIARYEWIEGEYLFNRCHLIGYQLTGQNDNELNLITGTRSMNTLGMEPYECEVASYVRYTGNHVLYRVTPVFEGKNLVASGVLMEAQSVEDDGAGIQFCVWCYNVEPGVEINYANGRNRSTGEMEGTVLPSESAGEVSNASASSAETSDQAVSGDLSYNYVLNTNSHKIHLPDCPSVAKMSERSKRYFEGTLEEARAEGYEPCGVCCP